MTVGNACAERRQRRDQPPGRQHHVDRHRDFRFQPRSKPAGAGLQPIHADASRRASARMARPASVSAGRRVRAVEQPQAAELLLEIGDRVADHRLPPVELARRGRKAPRLDDGQEHAELVQRGGTEVRHIESFDWFRSNLYRFTAIGSPATIASA